VTGDTISRVSGEHSALFHAGKVQTPSLVVHGDRDERVPVTQGWEFYNALRLRGWPPIC
jgi:dipeptidyl aminopeptidase/acylaminoacyl peptidase